MDTARRYDEVLPEQVIDLAAYTGLRFTHAREAFAASACRVLFCQSGWRRTLEQRGATGSMATAGRSRGALMVSDVCSLPIPSRHIDGFIRWRVWRVGAEGRAGFFLRDAPAVLAAGRAKGPSPSAGRSRGKLMG